MLNLDYQFLSWVLRMKPSCLGALGLATLAAVGLMTSAVVAQQSTGVLLQVVKDELRIEPHNVSDPKLIEVASDVYGISFQMIGETAEELARLTAGNVTRTMNIVIDGRIVAAPNLREPLHDGRILVTFNDRSTAIAVLQALGGTP